MLLPGDPAPYFHARSTVNRRFSFDTVAGRYVVLSFFGSSRLPASEAFLQEIVERGARFDVANVVFFGVTNDPEDLGRISHQDKGRIYFFDLDLSISKLYGVARSTDAANGDGAGAFEPPSSPPASSPAVQTVAMPTSQGPVNLVTPKTFILDQALRVVAVIEMSEDSAETVQAIFSVLDSLPPLDSLSVPPPVLVVPHVFEPALCHTLIDYYEAKGGEDSGFMRDVNGKTVGITDYGHKRRMDCEITDQELVLTTQERIKRRLVPAIKQAFQFHATRIERHIVACYDAAQSAHFRAHRDNTTLGTAHRRFAVTINLNSPEYEGGEIWFPEFSPRLYKAPSGAAIVFSCSLLHEVPRVTRGKRYAFLPFLYDDAAAVVRERNRKHLGDLTSANSGTAPTGVCASPSEAGKAAYSRVVIDGSSGCGNPSGCGTCLTSATYQLGRPAERGA
jgi:predicted 2-oxoglutarate/Fe(II)-dependent dioxygenase YbiX/peroxiredoxin